MTEDIAALLEGLDEALPPTLWGVCYGFRERNGTLKEEHCIVFLAHQKRTIAALSTQEFVPKEINGIPTDVRGATLVHHVADPGSAFNPLVGGVRMTAEGKAAYSGTLGGVFRHRATGDLVAVTNKHVMSFRLGLVRWWRQHGPVEGYQPMVTAADDIGVTIKQSGDPDCAAIRLNSSRKPPAGTLLRDASGRGELRITSIAQPQVGDLVFKVGARTGYTEGRVTATGPRVTEIRPRLGAEGEISDHGDSGSLWCRQEPGGIAAVGLHYAGTPGRPMIAYAVPMPRVAAFLDIEPL